MPERQYLALDAFKMIHELIDENPSWSIAGCMLVPYFDRLIQKDHHRNEITIANRIS
jgi:hypothetical protein